MNHRLPVRPTPSTVLRTFCASAALMASLSAQAQTSDIQDVLVVGEALSGMGNIRSEDVEGPFGLNQSIADIGRSITPVTEDMLNEVAIAAGTATGRAQRLWRSQPAHATGPTG